MSSYRIRKRLHPYICILSIVIATTLLYLNEAIYQPVLPVKNHLWLCRNSLKIGIIYKNNTTQNCSQVLNQLTIQGLQKTEFVNKKANQRSSIIQLYWIVILQCKVIDYFRKQIIIFNIAEGLENLLPVSEKIMVKVQFSTSDYLHEWNTLHLLTAAYPWHQHSLDLSSGQFRICK